MKYLVEYTDTYCGCANYSWCKRHELELPKDISDISLVRKAKAALGLTNVRCKVDRHCHGFALYPIGSTTVVFIVPLF